MVDRVRDIEDISIQISPQTSENGCPPPLSIRAFVNGKPADTWSSGGILSDPEDPPPRCDELLFRAPFEPGTNHVDITFEADDAPEVSSWHLAAEWDHPVEVWTDDERGAVAAGEAFSVEWSPEDAPAPNLDFFSNPLLLGDFSDEEIEIVELERSPGLIRCRLDSEPTVPWSVASSNYSHPDAGRCDGFASCDVTVSTRFPIIAGLGSVFMPPMP
jgi:hypothetical protein